MENEVDRERTREQELGDGKHGQALMYEEKDDSSS